MGEGAQKGPIEVKTSSDICVSEITETQLIEPYTETPYRWVILALSIMCLCSSMFSSNLVLPIISKISLAYGVEQYIATSPVYLGLLFYGFLNFPICYYTDKHGLRHAYIFALFLMVIGYFLVLMVQKSFSWFVLGSILATAGQPFINNTVTKVSTEWYLQANRPRVTSILTACKYFFAVFGCILALMTTKGIDDPAHLKDNLSVLYRSEGFFVFLNFGLVVIFMRSRPKKSPSAAANANKTQELGGFSILNGVKTFMVTPNLRKFTIGFVLCFSTMLAFVSLINPFLDCFGFHEKELYYQGMFILFGGVVGSLVYGEYLKRTGNYRNILLSIATLGVSSLITYTVLLWIFRDNNIQCVLVFLVGLTMGPIIFTGYELGCQLGFPIGEAQILGILNAFSNLFAFLESLFFSWAFLNGKINGAFFMQGGVILTILIGSLLLLSVDLDLKKKKFEQQARTKGTINQPDFAQPQSDRQVIVG